MVKFLSGGAGIDRPGVSWDGVAHPRALLLSFVLLTGCDTRGAEPPPAEPPPGTEPPRVALSATGARALREDARWILEAHCGQCHLPDGDRSLPLALAVFDLSAPEWAATMTDAQLEDAVGRLASDLTPDGEPLAVLEADRRRFGAYVSYLQATR
ncbi:MAG: hypothetical protein AB8I08_29900 [Sandaracinaceae bacterium]